jgi:hypothetical protein
MTVNEMSAYVADAWVEVIGPDNKVIYNEREHICYGDEAQGEKLESVINKEVDGGQIDFDFYIRDKYPTLCTTPIIDAVLKAAYDETDLSRYLISEGDRPGLGF